MSSGTKLLVIDPDSRRRAAVTHRLANASIHVEPFENTMEFFRYDCQKGVVLVYDNVMAIPALLANMCETGQWLPVVGFTENPSPRAIVRAVESGATDYIAWPFSLAEFRDVLESVQTKAEGIGRLRLRKAKAHSLIKRLTPREKQVLSAMANGMSNQLIGQRLSISPRTVEVHRANMLDKMGTTHSVEAIRVAIDGALVD